MSMRYALSADGRQFRREVFSALARRYRPWITEALAILGAPEFEFPGINKAHLDQLRPDLLFRHALPFCVTEEAYFALDAQSSKALAALLAGHTLALTHLDYHLDGSAPHPHTAATAVKIDQATAVAYSIRMIYLAGRLSEEVGGDYFRDIFDPVSGFVISRMHQDWSERYAITALDGTADSLHEYLHSSRSRLQASGYWEVMTRGSFARHRTAPPDDLVRVIRSLRTLRQVVDEIADFEDDLAAGLVTTPLLYALTGPDRAQIADEVGALWRHIRTSPSPAYLTGSLGLCHKLVDEAGGFRRAFEFADETWKSAVSLCSRSLGARAEGFVTLLDIKRAKLAELAKSNWHNIETEVFFR